MGGTRCLMDPVFQDPFEDTAVVSCPRRSIALDKIPPDELLVISHAHLDHFDIPSLAHVARTSKNADVLCPKDKTIVYALQQLGFTKVHPEESMKHFNFRRYEIVTTPSSVANIVEFGVIFKDSTGTFWNQVDTVIPLEVMPETLKQSGNIDLLFAMYASQNFNFFESRGTGFPHKMHEMNLNTVMAIKPNMAVPGSAGFRFAGAGMEWCNAFLFPMARERFVADLARLAPNIPTRIANPGDVFVVDGGKIEHRPAASSMAKMIEDDTDKLRFDPTAPIPKLEDPNPGGFSSERLAAGVEDCLEGFSRFVRDAYSAGDPVLDVYRRLRATYAVGVVFPDEQETWLRVTLDESEPRFERSTGTAAPSDAGHRIVASALTAWSAREKSYFYLRAFSRKWGVLYDLTEKDGLATITPNEPRDLLAYYLERKAKGAELALKQWLDFQLQPYVRTA
jgi:L-ascorbate metabolism protein UlaG (beta-lactamase superfamily)